MKVTLMLADFAQVAERKLYIMGGGWSVQSGPVPFGIAVKVEVPWDRAGETHPFRLELVDADGEMVEVPSPDGSSRPLVLPGQLSTGIAPGAKPGTPMDAVAAVMVGPLNLEPGRYAVRVWINEQTHEDWQLGFTRIGQAQAKAA